jgi:hypothetical protein
MAAAVLRTLTRCCAFVVKFCHRTRLATCLVNDASVDTKIAAAWLVHVIMGCTLLAMCLLLQGCEQKDHMCGVLACSIVV